MKVDVERTAEARKRHEIGVKVLNRLFRSDGRAGTPQDQRWLALDPEGRKEYRRWRAKVDPRWVERRRRRKRARAARKANR